MTVPATFLSVARRASSQTALREKRLGVYRDTTWRDLLARVGAIGAGLHALGVKKGDCVAIVGDPCAQWLMADLAAQCIGAISYGLYPTSSPDEVQFTLSHGRAKVLVAEDQEHVDKVLGIVESLPALTKIVVLDDSNMFGYEHPLLMSLSELEALGKQQAGATFEQLASAVTPEDPATIVYTSGTSARPKGAVYTHRGLVAQGHQFFAFPELAHLTEIRSVVHLPLNHLYERMNTPMGMLLKGIVPHFGEEADRFLEALVDVAPQHHASVPRYWSKLASRVIVGVENSSWLKRAAYAAAMRIGRRYRGNLWQGKASPVSAPLYRIAQLLVFQRMLKKIGLNRIVTALSAGAPLPKETQALWQVWGVNLKNLYGQTEGGVVTAQFDAFPEPGSVGRPYPGGIVRLGADDEILTLSPGCFAGYWEDPAATADAIRPEGIHTGDVGSFNAHGILSIIDRKKDIVITAGGKNVSPSRIETALKSSPYISEASVVGEARKYLSALIELDVGTVSEWARVHSVPYSSYQSLATSKAVNALIAGEIETANTQLGRVEQIKVFRILDRELDPEIEGEAVTATRKIKRSLLQQHFAHLIAEMYSDDEDTRIARQLATTTS